MSRRIKRTQTRSDRPADRRKSDRPREDRFKADRPKGDRPNSDRPKGDRPHAPRSERASRSEEWTQRERPTAKRSGGKPSRFAVDRERPEPRKPTVAPAKKAEPD